MKSFNDYNRLDTSAVDLSDKAKLSLYKKSSNSGISVDILEEVYRRGFVTWTEVFGGSPESFAFDRVNSFISGGFAAQLDEDLRNWFNPKHPEGGWKRIDSKGNVAGPCAREPGEPKPKCMSNEKRSKLSKKERAAAVAAKRRHDPVADRSGKGGKPVNVSNFGKGKISEEYLEEKNAPTNPSLWAKAKSLARSKFDVYPSAYANGWAAKWYKSKGGGWKSVSEETELDEKCWSGYKQIGMKKKGTKEVPDCVPVKEQLNVTTPSLDAIAKKHNTPLSDIKMALKKGIKVEKEHTKNATVAAEIAKDHLSERPDYYKKLEKVEKGPVKEETTRDLHKHLKSNGWSEDRTKGGHTIFKHPKSDRNISVPNHRGDLSPGVVRQIKKKAVISENAEKHSKDFRKPSSRFIGSDELVDVYAKQTPGQIIKRVVHEYIEEGSTPAWQRKEGKRETGGLNQKGVESYRRENPGSKLQTAVTTKPSKLKKGSKSWKRRKSFCSRMKGMKAKLTSAKTARDPDSRINKSLRAWNC